MKEKRKRVGSSKPSSAKSASVINSRFYESFRSFSETLDQKHEKQRLLGNASRELTSRSKKAIFQLHRATAENRLEILEQSSNTLQNLRKHIATSICSLLTVDSFYEYHRQISPGLQEYIEAAALDYYLRHETLPSPDQMQTSLVDTYKQHNVTELPLHINDYLLGIADVTGELMRRAISNKDEAEHICEVIRQISESCAGLQGGLKSREWDKKMNVMNSSLGKVEKRVVRTIVTETEMRNLAKT